MRSSSSREYNYTNAVPLSQVSAAVLKCVFPHLHVELCFRVFAIWPLITQREILSSNQQNILIRGLFALKLEDCKRSL